MWWLKVNQPRKALFLELWCFNQFLNYFSYSSIGSSLQSLFVYLRSSRLYFSDDETMKRRMMMVEHWGRSVWGDWMISRVLCLTLFQAPPPHTWATGQQDYTAQCCTALYFTELYCTGLHSITLVLQNIAALHWVWPGDWVIRLHSESSGASTRSPSTIQSCSVLLFYTALYTMSFSIPVLSCCTVHIAQLHKFTAL